ncbi:damage-inducible protein J [Dryocola clanedunensis]
MPNINLRIDEVTKRLAMQAAKRRDTDLTKLVRERIEELADEELALQNCREELWLEQEIENAFSRYDAGKSTFISNDDMENRMANLKDKAMRGRE